MIKGYVIQDSSSGLPSYYSLAVGREFASAHGWTAEADKALGFARQEDAQGFMEKYLPHVAPFATITPQQWDTK